MGINMSNEASVNNPEMKHEMRQEAFDRSALGLSTRTIIHHHGDDQI